MPTTTATNAPARDERGLPVISKRQAQIDMAQGRAQVLQLLERAENRVLSGDTDTAFTLVGDAEAALAWLGDRLAISDGGRLGRHLQTGDTPTT